MLIMIILSYITNTLFGYAFKQASTIKMLAYYSISGN